MLIKFLGQAGLMLDNNNIRLVCDPWFSDTGGFLARWHQYPPNNHIDLNKIRVPDYLYVSHAHHDHFDKRFLKTMPKDVKVILANFKTTELFDQFVEIGFTDITRLKNFETLSLDNNLKLTMLTDPSLYKEDSALLLESEEFKILNRNDCHLPDVTLNQIGGLGIDLLFSQYSGAMWYPACYEYPFEKKKILAEKTRSFLMDYFVKIVKLVNPKFVIPSAGPPCFLDDDEIFEQNFANNSIFPDQHDIIPTLKTIQNKRTTYNLMMPNDNVTLKHDIIYFDNFNKFDFKNKAYELEKYRYERRSIIQLYLASIPRPTENLYNQFKEHMLSIINSSQYIASKVGLVVHFDIFGFFGGVWQVDFNKFEISNKITLNPQYIIRTKDKYLKMILDGELSWEELFLSMRASAWRDPDIYNVHLFSLLRYGTSPELIKIIELSEIESTKVHEFINVNEKSKSYQIQKSCPHLGEDLTKAKIENGIITCSRHQWQFDLNQDGKCIFGGNKSLQCRTLENDEQTGLA